MSCLHLGSNFSLRPLYRGGVGGKFGAFAGASHFFSASGVPQRRRWLCFLEGVVLAQVVLLWRFPLGQCIVFQALAVTGEVKEGGVELASSRGVWATWGRCISGWADAVCSTGGWLVGAGLQFTIVAYTGLTGRRGLQFTIVAYTGLTGVREGIAADDRMHFPATAPGVAHSLCQHVSMFITVGFLGQRLRHVSMFIAVVYWGSTLAGIHVLWAAEPLVAGRTPRAGWQCLASTALTVVRSVFDRRASRGYSGGAKEEGVESVSLGGVVGSAQPSAKRVGRRPARLRAGTHARDNLMQRVYRDFKQILI